MDNILIRKVSKKDLSDILCLNLALFKKEFKEFDKTLNIKWPHSRPGQEYFSKKIIGKDSFVAVAVNSREIVGYICGHLHYSPTRLVARAELDNMLIVEGLRGKKIGSRLVGEFFKWCQAKKVKIVIVTAFVGNAPSINFYKKLGFTDFELTLAKRLR